MDNHPHKLILLILLLVPLMAGAQTEICDNGIDDDLDGLVDLNDDDCTCVLIQPVSVIPNPSFEDMDCCPSNRSQLECANGWIQASEPTTDYINDCGWPGWDDYLPPQPFPDGNGIMGFRDGRIGNSLPDINDPDRPFWKEYAGACLTGPLLAGTTYRFQFDVGFVNPQRSPPIDVSFFGTSNCINLPFGVGDADFGCPSNSPNWRKLGEVRVSGGSGNSWINTFIEVTPTENIAAIAIGPDCPPIISSTSLYYFFDNLLLADVESFEFRVTANAQPCSPDFALSIPFNPVLEYQWYKSGIALTGETASELSQNYGEGTYQVRVLDGESCRVSPAYEYVIPEFITFPSVTICEGADYPFGDLRLTEPGFYRDTFKNRDNCDSIVDLILDVISRQYDTTEASILGGQPYAIGGQDFYREGEYPLTLTSSFGCDSLVLLRLSNFDVYIPTAFSPNADGVNDSFSPFVPVEEVESIDLQIFDRWGNLLFQGAAWEGRDHPPGVYVYVANISFRGGYAKTFSGSLTLLR